MENLVFHSTLRWKMIITPHSHYLAHTFLFRKVERMYILNLGVKGLVLAYAGWLTDPQEGKVGWRSGEDGQFVVGSCHGSFDRWLNFGLVQNSFRQVELKCRLHKGQVRILSFVEPCGDGRSARVSHTFAQDRISLQSWSHNICISLTSRLTLCFPPPVFFS